MTRKATTLILASVLTALALVGLALPIEAAEAASQSERTRIHGRITDINGGTVVVNTGRERVLVVTNAQTTFRIIGDADPGLDDLGLGDEVIAGGELHGSQSLHADWVGLVPDGRRVGGRIDSVDESGLELRTPEGKAVRVNAFDNTVVAIRGHDVRWNPLGSRFLAEGMVVMAFGRPTGELTFAAHTIVVVDYRSGP